MTKAIVTGHSRGLGEKLAETLLARGVPVLAVSRRANAALGERYPELLTQVALDLSDMQAGLSWMAGEQLAAFLSDAQSPVLINNAGIVQPIGPAGTLDNAVIAQAMALNVTAPISLANSFIAMTAQAADRRIMHISSGAGREAIPGWSVYCATKAALDHHARCVVADAPKGLRIESLAPGVVDTDMQGEIRATTPDQFTSRERFVSLKQENQLADPQACAEAIITHLLGEAYGRKTVTHISELG